MTIAVTGKEDPPAEDEQHRNVLEAVAGRPHQTRNGSFALLVKELAQ